MCLGLPEDLTADIHGKTHTTDAQPKKEGPLTGLGFYPPQGALLSGSNVQCGKSFPSHHSVTW